MTATRKQGWKVALLAVALAIGGCGSGEGSGSAAAGGAPGAGGAPADPGPGGGAPADPGTPVEPVEPADLAAERQRLEAALAEVCDLTADELLERRALDHREDLGYAPREAAGLDRIQASPVALDEAELAILDAHGFAISERQRYPTFTYGYATIYMADLPLFVSADSILHAVHRSYDDLLKYIEVRALVPALHDMLAGMRARLAAGAVADFGEQTARDVDLYLAVALSLLEGEAVEPVAGADPGAIGELLAGAAAAAGAKRVELFGVPRNVDFSQFEPRGHYVDEAHPELENYFRAMMWLGRIDLRLIETQRDGSRVFRRRQLEAAFALRATMDDAAVEAWRRLDDTIRAFVGEPDNMTLGELDALLADLGGGDPAETLRARSDEELAAAILEGGYGAQRIASHLIVNGLGKGTLPLSSTFLLLGQRYVVDAHVFANVVYDRVAGGTVRRMMPDPLDVAYAALRNDQAAALLAPELREFRYAADLEAMRVLVDAHGEAFWRANLYNLWLGALRALSPKADEIADPAVAGLPGIAATEAWGRRLLSTQLASWAELRHDTLLYAKQSYTAGAACEFPDAYVDPYPEFYAALQRFAEHGHGLVERLGVVGSPEETERVRRWFLNLDEVASTLGEMAARQRRGEPFDDAHLAFINRAVRIQEGCGDPTGAEGWYADLFFENGSSVEMEPTIADVHTQPTDAAGVPVGRVLHVGTGLPRLMVMTAETCNGPRAYAGVVSSYFERVTEDYQRLTDQDWEAAILEETPPDVPWMADLVAR